MILCQAASAGESALTVTFQPLSGLGSGEITIASVTCHDWLAQSGMATAIGLISAKNVPPTNNPHEAKEDLNLASLCRVVFRAGDIGDPGAPLELIMDVSGFDHSKTGGYPREEIIRASLECLRRCLPEKLRQTPVTVIAKPEDRLWIEEIVGAFNARDRGRPFYEVSR